MFVGHLAVALGAKRAGARVPLGILVGAAFALDMLWPIFLLAGIERVRIGPGNTRFTPLAFDSYPWSHSLVTATAWGLVLAATVSRRLQSVAASLLVAGVVVSHWALDVATHRPDLPLWPGGPVIGLGLWNSVPGTLTVEGFMLLAAVAAYQRRFPPSDATGRWAFVSLVVFSLALWVSGPFSPPPPSARAVAWVTLGVWLFPLWAAWIERHRADAAASPLGVQGR
jgi:hypothetical protein